MKSSPQMMKDATGEPLSERFWIELLKDRFVDKKY
jgi:hypothetical protein